MNTLPALFEERMRKLLPEEAEAFFTALQTEPPVSIRLNPGKPVPISRLFSDEQIGLPVTWCESAYYLKSRPVFTLDPCLHSGTYYVQEASSMFLHHIFGQILPAHPVRVLDLCAAPGGKSTLIASRLSSDSLLVSNEVIRSRAGILKENMIKWGASHVVVTNNDPADFHNLKGAFDIIVVDAPCSGEGMFRKDPNAIQEWSENNLQLCSERQQRILADIWPCLKPGGFLVYSTCTYNPGENEAILELLIRKYGARSFSRNRPGKLKRPLLSFLSSPDSGRRIFYRSGTKKRRRRIQGREKEEKYKNPKPPPPRRHPGLYPNTRILPALCQRQYRRSHPRTAQ